MQWQCNAEQILPVLVPVYILDLLHKCIKLSVLKDEGTHQIYYNKRYSLFIVNEKLFMHFKVKGLQDSVQ